MISEPIYRGLVEGARTIGTFGHGYTYSGHPVAATAALATLELYEKMDIVAVVRRASERFQSRLRSFADHPLVGECRGVGLVGAIELTSDKAERVPFPPERGIAPAVVEAAQRNGVIMRAMINDTISFCPPLVITHAETDALFDRFGAALDEVSRREAQGLAA